MTGIAVEASELEEETTDYEEQIGRAVAANPEIEELVERIEAEQVDMLADEVDDLPSADSIAREFQQFLTRRQGGGAGVAFLSFRRRGRSGGSRTSCRR